MAYTGIVSGVRGAGNGLAANQKPDVWTALKVLEPYNSPAMQFVFFGKKRQKPVTNKQGKYSWFEDELFPNNTTISVQIVASSGKLTLTNTNVANVSIFAVDDLVLIEDNDEMARVESVATNTAVLSAPDGSNLSSTSATTGGYIHILASFNSEDAGLRTAMSTKEVEKTNYLTIMSATVSNTGRDQAGEAYTDGLTHEEQVQKKMKEMKFQFERLALLSITSGNANSSGSLVKTWGKGLQGLLTSNLTTYTTLTEAIFDGWLKNVGAKGTQRKTLYCGSDVFYKIQDIIKAKLGSFANNQVPTSYGIKVNRYIYGPVTADLIYDPVLEGKYSNWVFAIDNDNFVGRYMANDKKGSRKFRIEPNVETPGADYTSTKLLSDIGAQYMNNETGGILKK